MFYTIIILSNGLSQHQANGLLSLDKVKTRNLQTSIMQHLAAQPSPPVSKQFVLEIS